MAGTMIEGQLRELRARIEHFGRRRDASQDSAEVAFLDACIAETESEIVETERARVTEIDRELGRRAKETERFLALNAEKDEILVRHGELVLA